MRLAQHPRSVERLRRILGRVNADVTPTRTTVIVAAPIRAIVKRAYGIAGVTCGWAGMMAWWQRLLQAYRKGLRRWLRMTRPHPAWFPA